MAEKKSSRGGSRPGAGRKNLGLSERISVCLTKDLVPEFKRRGGAKWLREQLQTAPAQPFPTEEIFIPTDNPSKVEIPVFEERVQAGFPSPAESYSNRTLDLNEHLIRNPAATFFVYANGDSMNLAGIDEGDMLIVDRSLEPRNGDIVIMCIDNEFTVKRFKKDSSGICLLPESSNPAYKPISPREFQEWTFIGVVTHTVKSN